ncbi:prostasin-like [Xenopus laevis]|uniref:Prostasin-like n=1 Tax=Xenopus laevis TaxID=8355 RepID=A0A8J1LSI2_XENLA|nr:prostasin-like [Xenopus laevis]
MWIIIVIGLLNLLAGCGKPTTNRIVGGQDTVRGEFPWQLSLRKLGIHNCGGSLIDSQWAISAAHCFARPIFLSDYKVDLGAYQLSVPSGIVVDVAAVYLHPTFRGAGGSGDIALIKLAKPVQFTDYIIPICIPTPNIDFPNGVNSVVTGWGTISQQVSLPYPRTLQKVLVPTIARASCDQMYHIDNPTLPANQSIILWDMICAGYKAGKKGSCQGDSGGPLVYHWNGSWLLAGIVSWGFGCALPNRPGVYTSVTAYSTWIKGYVPGLQLTQAQIPAPNNSG